VKINRVISDNAVLKDVFDLNYVIGSGETVEAFDFFSEFPNESILDYTEHKMASVETINLTASTVKITNREFNDENLVVSKSTKFLIDRRGGIN